MSFSQYLKKQEKKSLSNDWRITSVAIFFVLLTLIIITKLVILMIFQHSFYTAMAANSHSTYSHLLPKRGDIYIQDSRNNKRYPIAMNADYYLLYADSRKILDDKTAQEVSNKLAEIFNYDDLKKTEVFNGLNSRTDPYYPIEKKIDEITMEKIKALNLKGIDFVVSSYRYYPEKNLASSVVGYVGLGDKGVGVGHYGIEGYWNKELSGSGGFFSGVRGAGGGLVPLSGWQVKEAEDGVNLVLTIDRNLQFTACEELRKVQLQYKAVSASLIIMDPKTGAIRVMCSLPDFDPNLFNQVKDLSVFNNNAIFTPYEPGSIFKAVTMAAGLNESVVTPQTTFVDTGSRSEFCKTPIRNAADKTYGLQNMSSVLENSINTGMVFVAEKLGKTILTQYINNFGFGIKTGIELETEAAGNIESLTKNKGNKIDCYAATASFGQGLTATPLQMTVAYSAIANGGKVMKPYIVDEISYPDGRVEKTRPKEILQVISNRASLLLGGMLVNVVDLGHAKKAAVKGYYIGGKTGTAQISGLGGYTDFTNHSFVGIVPVDNPKFVMFVKLEKPEGPWAENTVVPIFGQLADYVLKYYQIPPSR